MQSRLSMILCLFTSIFVLSFATVAQETEPPFIQQWACPFEIPEGEIEGETLDCGSLVTYEDHFSDEGGAYVELAFVILYSINEGATDPVIYLAGGPGNSALTGVHGWVGSDIRMNNDLILLDQRG